MIIKSFFFFLTLFHKASSTSNSVIEPEPINNICEWKGTSMNEIFKGLDTYDCEEFPPISPSANHTVLILVRTYHCIYNLLLIKKSVIFCFNCNINTFIIQNSYQYQYGDHQSHILPTKWINGARVMYACRILYIVFILLNRYFFYKESKKEQ